MNINALAAKADGVSFGAVVNNNILVLKTPNFSEAVEKAGTYKKAAVVDFDNHVVFTVEAGQAWLATDEVVEAPLPVEPAVVAVLEAKRGRGRPSIWNWELRAVGAPFIYNGSVAVARVLACNAGKKVGYKFSVSEKDGVVSIVRKS